MRKEKFEPFSSHDGYIAKLELDTRPWRWHLCLNFTEQILTPWWPLCWVSAKVPLARFFFSTLHLSPLSNPFQPVSNFWTTEITSCSSFFEHNPFLSVQPTGAIYLHNVLPWTLYLQNFFITSNRNSNHLTMTHHSSLPKPLVMSNILSVSVSFYWSR